MTCEIRERFIFLGCDEDIAVIAGNALIMRYIHNLGLKAVTSFQVVQENQ